MSPSRIWTKRCPKLTCSSTSRKRRRNPSKVRNRSAPNRKGSKRPNRGRNN
ncbi:unnamed protein product, partial [Nesidiocoris tenuis]